MMQHPSNISITEFSYELPADKIAMFPLEKRDESRLLIYKNTQIQEDQFKNIDAYLDDNSHLVFNNTRVIPARLNFTNQKDKTIEIFCLEPAGKMDVSMAMLQKGKSSWNCLVGNLRQWKEDELILSKNGLTLTASINQRCDNYVIIDFSWEPSDLQFSTLLENVGAMPIPPYLKRKSDESDALRYQTIYAKQEGSVAAPTAGLHFTEEVLEKVREKKISMYEVTLHVGAGTFKPVKSATMEQHEMHAEWIEVDAELIEQLANNTGKKTIAVGTTSLRTLESLYWMGFKAMINPAAAISDLEVEQWDPYKKYDRLATKEQSLTALLTWMRGNKFNKLLCRTRILIAPPYQLKIADGIITNFHQPQSTLLLLISAIVGTEWKSIYNYALTNNFRFLSYGDSSLLLK